MEENLVIVESPAKAKTITKFLGKNFVVKSSFGHIRDLSKKNLGIDVEKKFKPDYIVSPDKKKLVSELKKMSAEAKTVWLASDEDREGEAIAWHLADELKLKREKTKRIVFHEITKEAIVHAIENPREIDINLVNAQQARRILDRLVGFEISPILWRKIKPALSAGRVQSVAVKLIVEREREICAFNSESKYRVNAIFEANGKRFKAELSTKFDTFDEARDFLQSCLNSRFSVKNITVKPGKKSPAPPFTTSTLQQEAGRKLNFSVAQTMRLAQTLYETGKITYMRTDSVHLSNMALGTIKNTVISEYGEKYLKTRQFQTKAKGAQEAHEAIRPTYSDKKQIEGTKPEQKLYELIWKRTIASQMADAQVEKTIIEVEINNSKYKFVAEGEVIVFEGFLKLYNESSEDENGEEKQGILPKLTIGDELAAQELSSTEKYSVHPPRYNEAGLVKKLEELGIGRPSTYAPTISTIQQREYITKESKKAEERNINCLIIKNNKVEQFVNIEKFGAESNKLFPTSIGILVTDFLSESFPDIMNYNFTAAIEKQFDEIAAGSMEWTSMIDNFYKTFHPKVETTLSKKEVQRYERNLGAHPQTGEPIFVKLGKFGAFVQMGENSGNKPPQFASLKKNQNIETITTEDALELFKMPRDLGLYNEKPIIIGIGKFGPYIKYNNKFYSLKKAKDDPYTISFDRSVEIINENSNDIFPRTFPEKPGLTILKGRFGPYISYDRKNYKIPRDFDPITIELEDCLKIIGKNQVDNDK
ncbi:MAG TPA: type I DNA topoisomerase [Bacteroidales bacterium]|nr:type I DNA topoisomerase [Bacteroidales bacterium]